MLDSSLAKRKDMNVDVYSVDYFENLEVARLYGVTRIPTAIFMENGVPMSRMTGIEYAEEFLEYVNGVVVEGRYPLTPVSDIPSKTPVAEQTFVCEPWMRDA
jgi:thioredoxin-like negative regulator of GroEL